MFAVAVGLSALLFGCEKEINFEPSLTNTGQLLCINGRHYDGYGTVPDKPSQSPKQTLVFRDEFNGRENDPGDSTGMNTADCYDRAPLCVERLDWSMIGPCTTQDFSNLRDLNKCKWEVWDGYSFWDDSRKLAFNPSALNVSGGNLNIQFKVRPGEHTDCGRGPTHPDGGYGRDCKVFSGGIDSKYRDSTKKGFNFKESRVEIRAAVPATNYIWPALWTWNGDPGPGYPHHQNQTGWAGEYDILEIIPEPGRFEAFQTYHTWNFGGEHHSTGAKNTAIKPDHFHRYGIERWNDAFLFSVDDCYTRIVRNGDADTKNIANSIKVDNSPEYLIMSMGYDNRAAANVDALDGTTFKVDYVRVYE